MKHLLVMQTFLELSDLWELCLFGKQLAALHRQNNHFTTTLTLAWIQLCSQLIFFLSFSEVKNIFLGVLWKLLVNIWSFFSLSNDSLKAEFCCIVHILHYSGWISGQVVFCFVFFSGTDRELSVLFSVLGVAGQGFTHALTHTDTQTALHPGNVRNLRSEVLRWGYPQSSVLSCLLCKDI